MMKQQIKLTESELKLVIENSVKRVIKEFEDSDMEYSLGDENDDFNEQPTNDVVGENKIKVTESELKDIIKESVKRLLKEVGETEKGQELLGRLAARKSTGGDINGFYDVEDYAKNKRNGNLKMKDKYSKGFHAEKNKKTGR